MRRCGLLLSWIAGSAALVAAASTPAFGAARVHFLDGRTLEVSSCTIVSGIATVTLEGGGTVSFPSGRVTRVETIAEVRRIETPQPAPEHGPVTPVPAPVAQAPAGSIPAPAPPAVDAAAVAAPQPALPSEATLEDLIRASAARYNLEVDLLAAVIATESGYKPRAVSPKGAQGLMQLMPATARELSVTDPFNPAQNIDAGAKYLRQLIDQHEGSYWRALAAYNAGARRASEYGGLPPYRETISYIHRVLENYARPKPIPSQPIR